MCALALPRRISAAARRTLGGVVAVAAAFSFSTAHADTLQLNGFAVGSVATQIIAPVAVDTPAGMFSFTNLTTGANLLTFCVEVTQSIASPDPNYSPSTLAADAGFTSAVKTSVDKLFTAFFGGIGSDATKAAAFQIALWEIVTDSAPGDVTSGSFRVSPNAATTLANTYLAGLAGAATGGWNLTVWRSRSSQDQISVAPVPEPSTFALVATALIAFAMIGRRARVRDAR